MKETSYFQFNARAPWIFLFCVLSLFMLLRADPLGAQPRSTLGPAGRQLTTKATPEKPCCAITAVNAQTGLVTARYQGTGLLFQFNVANSALVRTLKVGQNVWANFSTKGVSLDGLTQCCPIVSVRQPKGGIAGGRQPPPWVRQPPIGGKQPPIGGGEASRTPPFSRGGDIPPSSTLPPFGDIPQGGYQGGYGGQPAQTDPNLGYGGGYGPDPGYPGSDPGYPTGGAGGGYTGGVGSPMGNVPGPTQLGPGGLSPQGGAPLQGNRPWYEEELGTSGGFPSQSAPFQQQPPQSQETYQPSPFQQQVPFSQGSPVQDPLYQPQQAPPGGFSQEPLPQPNPAMK